MAIIQWYPGHMTKATREMEANVKKCDVVIYVLDSRAINACINPKFDSIIKNKPVLYVFNKADTVEPGMLKPWCDFFDAQGKTYVKANSAAGKESGLIISKIKELCSAKIQNYLNKGVNTSIRAMVLGIPNGGKSTLINSLCSGKKTVTGDRPGVTKGQQWVSVSKGIDLLDTPGTLWPSFEDQELAKHLVYIGSIKDDVVDKNEICLFFLEFMQKHYPENLVERYKLDALAQTPLEIYEQIARARGYVVRGGETDYDRTAAAVLDDFRKQRLGKIILEYPVGEKK